MRDAAAYSAQLRQLLPQGRAWTAAPGGVLALLLDAIGEELARVDRRIFGLIGEADP